MAGITTFMTMANTATISGAPTVAASDAGFVNKFADINEPENMILSLSLIHI